MVVPWKTVGVLTLVLIGAGSAWQFQDWRYGRQLAEQARLHAGTLNQITQSAATARQAEQDKRLALEQRLSASDQSHHKELTDAQTNQARLRDRLATSDLRLSVLLDASDPAGRCSVPEPVPKPAAWFMEARAPSLTLRMLNELSPSPTAATKD